MARKAKRGGKGKLQLEGWRRTREGGKDNRVKAGYRERGDESAGGERRVRSLDVGCERARGVSAGRESRSERRTSEATH